MAAALEFSSFKASRFRCSIEIILETFSFGLNFFSSLSHIIVPNIKSVSFIGFILLFKCVRFVKAVWLLVKNRKILTQM
jgi:hypothetical protein